MHITNFHDLFEHELADLYSVEKQLIDALPKMINASSDEKLTAALKDHLEVTKKHLDRLDQIAEAGHFKNKSLSCQGIKGIISEAEEGLKHISDPDIKNAAIIAAAQRAEHYEIAAYGIAAEFARQLDMDDAAGPLEDTLNEEKAADAGEVEAI